MDPRSNVASLADMRLTCTITHFDRVFTVGLMNKQDQLDQEAGAALKELRISSGRSQEALAADAGVDQSQLSKMERHGPGAGTWRRFRQIANALGYEVEICLRPRSDD